MAASLDNRDVCRIASAADVDHRTVESFLAGAARSRETRARARIVAAMERLGLGEHVPKAPGLAKVQR